jgi:diguanylate cyclase (GGDEF)-like protein
MTMDRSTEPLPQPQTRRELHAWVRETLSLPPDTEAALFAAFEAVFSRHERLWQESKDEAIQAVSAGFALKILRLKEELEARDETLSSVSRYFEQLVAELTDRSHRDPKTKLMNFGRFTDQLESFFTLDQRGRWCAVGLVDIAGFKLFNDTLGHAVGDLVIERVAALLREQVRSDDLLALDRGGAALKDLHARFGGDEFCFFIPDLPDPQQASAIADRFRDAVECYGWGTVDPRLAEHPVRVDVGVVCLWLGRVAERRPLAGSLAAALIQRADELMYEAKGRRAAHTHLVTVRIANGKLVESVRRQFGLAAGRSHRRVIKLGVSDNED